MFGLLNLREQSVAKGVTRVHCEQLTCERIAVVNMYT